MKTAIHALRYELFVVVTGAILITASIKCKPFRDWLATHQIIGDDEEPDYSDGYFR